MAYLITYDLDNPGQNYKNLIEHLETYPAWAKMTESCWCVASDKAAKEIRDDLKPFIDSNDKLLVVHLSGEAAWTGLPKDVSDWIHNNV